MGALPLDPHTNGFPTFQEEKKNLPPPQRQLRSTTFVSNGIFDGQELDPDVNSFLYKEPPLKIQELLEYFSQKYHQSNKLVIKQWDYQGGDLGKEEIGIIYPVEAYKESKKKGIGFEQPTTRGH